ncbi:MAG TPA: FGGY-family carbohydrate kinase [Pyrinomonadaceae bacterium]|nr:FGGY-family carbohydrate kinase [Pyrinomonadaceae bacterium]
MNKRALFLGLDLGTTAVKVGVIDAEGQLLARAEVQYRTESPQPGWVEQKPEEWWAACVSAIKDVVLQVDPALVQGLCVAGQSPALVCLNDLGEPVRPASIWSDQRAVREADEVAQSLGPFAPFSLLPRLLWLKRHEPTHYLRTKWVFESFDYISFKLTHHVASTAPAGQSWDPRDTEAIGLEPDKFPTCVCRLGEVFGSLAPDVAARLGLPAELPVIAGTIDAFAAWIGTATLSKGSLCNTAGTSEGVAIVWHQPLSDPEQRVVSIPHITGRDWIVGGAMSTGGIMLDWFSRAFYDRVTNPYVAVAEEAKSVTAGAEGLIVLPYLVGERAPMFDPDARGVFFGITGNHTRAHLARAVLESVAFAVRDVCEVIQEMGAEIGEVRVAGGGARNDVWNQIKADVLGRRVLVPEIAESGLLGAAIIAGWGTGYFANLADAAQTMVKFRAVLEPNPRNQAVYTALFELYRSLYMHLKVDFATLCQLKRTHFSASSTATH